MVITRGKWGWGEVGEGKEGINAGGKRMAWGGEHTNTICRQYVTERYP